MAKINKRALAELKAQPRRWGICPTLDWYILREFLTKLAVLILVFAILFLLGDVFHDLSDFLEAGASPLEMLAFFAYKFPGNIRFVFPLAMLLGCMWTMAAFGKNLEVTAMRASGISLFRCGGAIIVVGFIVTFINIYFNELLVPETEYLAEKTRDVATNPTKKRLDKRRTITYRSLDKRRNWLFLVFDREEGHRTVTLKHYAPDGETVEWYLVADRAVYDSGKGWTFYDVQYTEYGGPGGMLPRTTENIAERNFTPREIVESPDDILNSVKDEEDLPSWVIWRLLHKVEGMPAGRKAVYWTVFFYRLSFPWSCLLAVFLGIPLATKNERSGIMLSVVMAVVIIIAYIMLSQVGLILGKQGILPPALAGLGPTIGFIIYGISRIKLARA